MTATMYLFDCPNRGTEAEITVDFVAAAATRRLVTLKFAEVLNALGTDSKSVSIRDGVQIILEIAQVEELLRKIEALELEPALAHDV